MFFRHDDLPDRELYACKRYCHITEEGTEPDLFEVAQEIVRAEGTNQDENVLVPQVTTDAENFKEKHYQQLGKTTGLLFRLCSSLFGSSTVVILDSGFCVLKAIIELKKRGVYAAAVIKKRRYWPKHVKGDEIKAAKVQQPLGTQSRLPGKYDNIPFDLFTSNEPDYVQIFMSTYGTINPKVNQKKIQRRDGGNIIDFYHSEVVANHYQYRDAVDAHNSKRHDGGTKQGFSIETTWHTNHWPNRVFAFILGLCEVNAFLGRHSFRKYKKMQMQFRRELAYAFLHNDRDEELGQNPSESVRQLRSSNVHVKVTMMPHCIWTDGQWKKKFKNRYQQRVCSTKGCKHKTRTYCKCSMGRPRCNECFMKHVIDPDIHV